MFTLLKTEGKARRGELTCAHGTAQTPAFMNVGTQGAIKGAVSAHDLKEIGCQIELSNTYHLHRRVFSRSCSTLQRCNQRRVRSQDCFT